MDIFDLEIQSPTTLPVLGKEPSLRKLIKLYYTQHFDAVKADELTEGYIARLSAQPSPGGQGATFPWENFPAYLIDKCEGDTISEEGLQQALAAMVKDERYSLAARQPVGEPVMYRIRCQRHPRWREVDAAQFTEHTSHGWEGQKLYADPPTQAVDLAQFRPAVAYAARSADFATHVEIGNKLRELLALIDSRKKD